MLKKKVHLRIEEVGYYLQSEIMYSKTLTAQEVKNKKFGNSGGTLGGSVG